MSKEVGMDLGITGKDILFLVIVTLTSCLEWACLYMPEDLSIRRIIKFPDRCRNALIYANRFAKIICCNLTLS